MISNLSLSLCCAVKSATAARTRCPYFGPTIIVTDNKPTGFDLPQAQRQIRKNETIIMVSINIDPVEVIIGEGRQHVLRFTAMLMLATIRGKWNALLFGGLFWRVRVAGKTKVQRQH